jgi:hypothetical protein
MSCETIGVSLRRVALVLLGLALLAPISARAQESYKIQAIVKRGDRLGELRLASDTGLSVGGLNDSGALLFSADNSAGGVALIQYADGQFTPIVAAGLEGPLGKWSKDVTLWAPASMNQQGNAVVSVGRASGDLGIFRWEFQARQLTPVALKDTPAANGPVFDRAPGGPLPVISDRNEIAFVAQVKNASGEPHYGVFLIGGDGKLQPVVLPDQELPDGGKVLEANTPSLNSAGMIALRVRRVGEAQSSAYLWEQGTLTPLAVIGQDAPGGRGKLADVGILRVNERNRNVLLMAHVDRPTSPRALYLLSSGNLIPVAVPGQEMPGGGVLKGLQEIGTVGASAVSPANGSGQHAFLAELQDGSSAAYRMDEAGTLSLILKSGTATDLGTITDVGGPFGAGIGLNGRGEVALPVQIEGGAIAIVLLTPVAP